MKEITNCLICGSTKIEPFLSCRDYTVSQKIFQIKQCGECGFKFTSPRPEDSGLGAYYKSEDYVSHSDTKKGLINTLYHWVRSYTLIKKLQLVMHFTKLKKGKMLDYGAGTGAFLNTCKKNGWDVCGVEPDSSARTLMQEKYRITSYSSIDGLNEDKSISEFDAITAWHVLEHVPELNKTIESLKVKLKPKSILIVAVPNCSSYDAKYFKEYWAAYDVPRHLWHFTPKDMISLISQHGFRLEKILPMAFDSFYVSLLSQKHKTGSSGLLKAFWIGLLSNIKANKTGKEFSSQIYVFRKE